MSDSSDFIMTWLSTTFSRRVFIPMIVPLYFTFKFFWLVLLAIIDCVGFLKPRNQFVLKILFHNTTVSTSSKWYLHFQYDELTFSSKYWPNCFHIVPSSTDKWDENCSCSDPSSADKGELHCFYSEFFSAEKWQWCCFHDESFSAAEWNHHWFYSDPSSADIWNHGCFHIFLMANGILIALVKWFALLTNAWLVCNYLLAINLICSFLMIFLFL